MQDVSAVSWWDMTPLEVREKINQRCMNTEAPIPTVWAVEDRTIENSLRTTPIRVYLPNQEKKLPIILLIHGGAWVGGNLDTHDNLARYLCSQVEALVVSVGYTNAPEGKYPLQLHQSLDALTWIIDPSNEFAADSSRIAIVGDSAGGNMSAALCLMLRDQQGPKIDLQVLINPAPDLTGKGTIIPQNDALDMLRWQAFQYLSDPKDASHPYVSPLIAENLNHLPPALILLAENDDLREAGQHYADRLLEAGNITQVYCQKGVNHLAGDGARASLKARESLDVAVAALRRAFSKGDTVNLNHKNWATTMIENPLLANETPMIEYQKKRFFIGLPLRTNNDECSATIPAHKDRFFKENTLAKIPNKQNGNILALYTDYEGDFTKPYSWIIGCEVSSLEEVPEGLTGKVIPESRYAIYTTQGGFPQGLIATWNAIWKSDLPRTYTTDFEVYRQDFDPQNNPEVKVYIAIE